MCLAVLVPAPVLRAQGGCTPATVMSPGGNGVALEGTSVSGDGRYLAFDQRHSDELNRVSAASGEIRRAGLIASDAMNSRPSG